MNADRYYIHCALAFIRGKLNTDEQDTEKLFALAKQQELRLHKFKRNRELPRVSAVLGILKNIQPTSLLDIGTGRGVFLWPLLDTFPTLPITATDIREDRIRDLQAIHKGGVKNLNAHTADVTQLPFADAQFDVVTALETVEHVEKPDRAIQEVFRVAKRHAIFSVPSKEDNNPEHKHLVTQDTFHQALQNVQCTISFQYVLNHMIVMLTKKL